MKNSEKTELKYEVISLAEKGYSQKEAIKILKSYGYCESTARGYWKVFSWRGSQLNKTEEELAE